MRHHFIAWRCQAITWIKFDLSSVRFSDINLRAISLAISQPSVTKFSLKITFSNFHWNLLGANEFKLHPYSNFIYHMCTRQGVHKPTWVFSFLCSHYNGVIMGAIASQITSLTIVYSIVYSEANQRKHQSSASLAFVQGIHLGPVNSRHKCPVTRKVFPFDDEIMPFTET